MVKPTATPNGELNESLRALLQAGVELGVAEAVRQLSARAPVGSDWQKRFEVGGALAIAGMTELINSIQEGTSQSVFQIVKEVWSRGGTKERRTAAHALGHGLGKVAPHRALGLSRDLASMARNAKEADLVGSESIGPLLEANPPLWDRVKLFLEDNEPWVRRAAIAGLVAYAMRKKKLTGLAVEAVVLLAEHNEKEIRDATRWAIRELSKIDWKATANGIVEWVKKEPTQERVKTARQYVAATAASVRKDVQRFVFTRLAKFADGAKALPAR